MITWSDIAALLSTLYWGSMVLLLLGAVITVFMLMREGKRRMQLLTAVLIGIPGVFYLYPKFYQTVVNRPSAEERVAMAKYKQAKAIFDERCKTAGEQIYRTASDVEGITLLNIYPEVASSTSYNPRNDPMWQGAALPQQIGDDRYILSFLGWSQKYEETVTFSPNYTSLVKPKHRLKSNSYPRPVIAYKNYTYVDIETENKHLVRYMLYPEEEITNEHYWFHQRIKNQSISRYAVFYESIIDAYDRQNWIAGAKVSIIDQMTQELMATKTWYAFAPSMEPMGNGRLAWRHALHCPQDGSYRDPVVKFVISVIQPKQGD